MEKFWHRSINNYLRCEPEEHNFILTETPMNSPENREQMAEIMFETFNVKGLYIGVQATLALFAQLVREGGGGVDLANMDLGRLTGTVIDSGDGLTHVFPVCQGYVVGSCIRAIPLAGSDITAFIGEQIKARKESIPTGTSLPEIAQKIKEDHCYCAPNLMDEFKKYDRKKADGEAYMQSKKFKKFVYKALNGKMVNIDLGYERFLAPEMFFHPVSPIF